MRILGLLIVLVLCGTANAASIVYNVGLSLFNGGFYGDIVTDGTIGTLSTANLVSWDLFLNNGADPIEQLTPSNSTGGIGGSVVTATLSGLFFNFDGAGGGIAFLSNSGDSEACLATGDGCDNFSALVLADNDDNNFAYAYLIGNDQIGTAPEPSTLALLGAGAAMLGFRKRWR